MVFTQKPISPGESGTEDRPQKSVSNPGGVGLDLYRISDRCTASVSAASSGNAEKPTKNGDFSDRTLIESECGTSSFPESSVFSPASASWALSPLGHESTVAGASCPSPIPFRRLRPDPVTGELQAHKIELINCNNKYCPVCGPSLRKKFVGHFTRLFSPLPNLVFLTLTLDPKVGISVEDSRKYVGHIWSRFRKRMDRRGRFEYVAATESHKSGYTHLHVLASIPEGMKERETRTQWFLVGGGVVMDYQPLTGNVAQAVGYVIKYVFKDAARHPKKRSMRVSRGFSYYAEEHKAARKKYAEKRRREEEAAAGKSQAEPDVEFWEPLTFGVAKGNEDTPTKEDLQRFRELSKSLQRTTLYVHEHGGRRLLAYYDAKSKSIQTKEIAEGLTRSMLSREIARIKAEQGVP